MTNKVEELQNLLESLKVKSESVEKNPTETKAYEIQAQSEAFSNAFEALQNEAEDALEDIGVSRWFDGQDGTPEAKSLRAIREEAHDLKIKFRELYLSAKNFRVGKPVTEKDSEVIRKNLGLLTDASFEVNKAFQEGDFDLAERKELTEIYNKLENLHKKHNEVLLKRAGHSNGK